MKRPIIGVTPRTTRLLLIAPLSTGGRAGESRGSPQSSPSLLDSASGGDH